MVNRRSGTKPAVNKATDATEPAAKRSARAPDAPVQNKPTAKQLVGGSSWTGKIPTTLLQEYCQKQGWARCDYAIAKTGQLFAVRHVLLSKKNPKNNEVTNISLRPTPETAAVLPDKGSPLEARNVAAIFALHRIASDRSWLMQLPPEYRDIWKALVVCKQADDKANKSWMYASDPFRTAKEHELQKEAWVREAAKRGEELRKTGHQAPKPSFDWQRAPTVEMSRDFRQRIETMVRGTQLSLSQKEILTPEQRHKIIASLVQIGFRQSHAIEALENCSAQEDALEWLLLYVPEDDLPPRFLPPGYSIGISTSQHDTESLRLDYAARRLSRAGYPLANARKVMLEQGDEYLAAEVLQASLLEIPLAAPTTLTTDQPEWDIEVEGIAATFGDSFHFDKSMKECKLSIPENEAYSLHLRPPVSDLYPDALPTFFVSSKGKLPAYVKLAVAQQLGLYAVSLKGEAMIFSLLSWLQTHLERILENPGRLQQLSTITTGISGKKRVSDLASPAQKTPQSFQWDCDSAESFAIKKQRDTLLASESHQMKLQNRQKLPAWAARSEILDALKHHSTLIISGETGSGKSTQVVQFVLDALITDGHGDIANIICTQPRRISAIGLADRVAEERSSAVGAQVGYQIRGENKTSRETKISFVTTGVLLRKLATAGDVALERVTHIFVDEVHERSVESDFLLILLKDLLTRRKDLKVVLMSATLNADFFASYLDARQLTIQGRTFPVTDFYVEDMDFLSAGSGPREKSKNGVDYDMIVDLVSYIHRVSGADPSGILIFLPGVMEITRCIQAINKTGPSGLRCLPLHASLPSHEQRKVFRSTPGSRKVVVATNIAETSITIDDIGSVIDTGKVKQMAFDPILNAYKFEEVWCSKAACQQRRGRAGRVKAGFCYKTFSRALETAKMLDSTPPEILRVPLEQVCLSVLAMNKPVSTFLDRAITPPPLTSLEAAMAKLKAIGALDLDASLEKLTPLGRHLSLIAADVHCAKLLVLSTMFSCTEEALTIASALSSKPIFLSTPEAKEAHLAFGSRDGDLIAILNAYNEWTSQETGRSRREWSKTRFISDLAMQEIASTRFQLWSCLREAGLARSRLQDKAGDITVLKSLIGASLSPNVAKIAFPSTKYAQHQSGSIAKDHESREIKFFASNGRVFLHPSSVLFTESEYRQAAFVAFHQQVETSKRFIKQNTPVSIYSQLLFGHSLQLDGQGQGLVVNNWIKLQAFPKIGVLCRLIRIMLDDVLSARFDNPRHETQPAVLDLIRELLISNGVSI